MTSRLTVAVLALSVVLAPGLGQAATTKPTDQVSDHPLPALDRADIQERIGADISFVFADTPGPTPQQGRVKSRKQARNSGRGVQADCEDALIATLQSMAISARKHGATRVVNVRSFWDGYPTSSATTYRCGRGKGLTSVSLVGNFADPSAQVK